jgi:diacylglycerol kinase family enzyme
MVLISNNPYVMSGPPDFGRRVRLDSGRLGIVADVGSHHNSSSPGVATRPKLSEWAGESFQVDSDQELLDVGVDGEALSLAPPIIVSTKPRALRVLVPDGTRPGAMPPLRRRETTADHLSGLRGDP